MLPAKMLLCYLTLFLTTLTNGTNASYHDTESGCLGEFYHYGSAQGPPCQPCLCRACPQENKWTFNEKEDCALVYGLMANVRCTGGTVLDGSGNCIAKFKTITSTGDVDYEFRYDDDAKIYITTTTPRTTTKALITTKPTKNPWVPANFELIARGGTIRS